MNELIAKILATHEFISTRDAFGWALMHLGGKDKRIIVLDADLSYSTRTRLFAERYPERFFNVGIAEQDMLSIGAGLASCDKIPVVVTYATFLTGRGLDQIRNMIAYCNLNVKLVGTHAGLATSEDGATHQALEDIGIMRGIPGMRVISPSDAVETIQALQYALKTIGPIYIRISKEKGKIFHDQHYQFQPARADVLSNCSKKRVALFATGTMVLRALEAAELLREKAIGTCVVNIHTIKPIDKETITKIANEVELVVTIEDHNIIGGLGSTVADILAEIKPKAFLGKIGVEDCFGESGSCHDLYKKYGLTTEQIVERILENMEMM